MVKVENKILKNAQDTNKYQLILIGPVLYNHTQNWLRFSRKFLNLQLEHVGWIRFFITETKIKQYFNLIWEDWVLVYWNWSKNW